MSIATVIVEIWIAASVVILLICIRRHHLYGLPRFWAYKFVCWVLFCYIVIGLIVVTLACGHLVSASILINGATGKTTDFIRLTWHKILVLRDELFAASISISILIFLMLWEVVNESAVGPWTLHTIHHFIIVASAHRNIILLVAILPTALLLNIDRTSFDLNVLV